MLQYYKTKPSHKRRDFANHFVIPLIYTHFFYFNANRESLVAEMHGYSGPELYNVLIINADQG